MPGGYHTDVRQIQIFELVVPQCSFIFSFGFLQHEQSAHFVHNWELPYIQLDDFCFELDIFDNEFDPSIGHKLTDDEPHFIIKFLPFDAHNIKDICGDGFGIVEEVSQNRVDILVLIFGYVFRNVNVAELTVIEIRRVNQ